MHAALHLPAFPLEALLRCRPELRQQPCAVIDPAQPDERARAKTPLLAVNPPAASAGTHPGMPAVHALARCPGLVTLDRHPASEHDLASQLLHLAHTLAPRIEATSPDSLLLDISTLPAARQHPANWLANTLQTLTPLGVPVHAALADNPLLARLASHSPDTSARLHFNGPEPATIPPTCHQPVTPAQLHPLPLSLLLHFHLDPDHLEFLHQLGIHSIGDFTRLPPDALGERFGIAICRLHELLRDQIRHPISHQKMPEKYMRCIEFEHPVNSLHILIFHSKRLLEMIVPIIRSQHRPAIALRLELGFADAPVHRRLLRLPEPVSDPALLLRPLQVYLESLCLPGPVNGLLLEVLVGPAGGVQHSLFGRALSDPHRLAATLARLESLLGPDAVGIPVRADSHRPDSFRMEPFNPGEFGRELGKRARELPPPPLPLRRLRPPLSLAVAADPGGGGGLPRPLALLSGPYRGRVLRSRGPFALSGHWWEPGLAWQQAEWDLELESGYLLRLALVPPDDWQLQGRYG